MWCIQCITMLLFSTLGVATLTLGGEPTHGIDIAQRLHFNWTDGAFPRWDASSCDSMHRDQGTLRPRSAHVIPMSSHFPTPRCVPCRGVPDGPLAGNGDLGITIGGNSGPLGLPEADSHALPPPSGLGYYFGKNDFWGFPDAVTYHASFQVGWSC